MESLTAYSAQHVLSAFRMISATCCGSWPPGGGLCRNRTSLCIMSPLPVHRTPGSGPLATGMWPLLLLSEPLCPLSSSRPQFPRHLLRVFCAAPGIAANDILRPHSRPARAETRGKPQARPLPRCTFYGALSRPPMAGGLIHLDLCSLEQGKPRSRSSVNICGMDYGVYFLKAAKQASGYG